MLSLWTNRNSAKHDKDGQAQAQHSTYNNNFLPGYNIVISKQTSYQRQTDINCSTRQWKSDYTMTPGICRPGWPALNKLYASIGRRTHTYSDLAKRWKNTFNEKKMMTIPK
jgi:hypothetical protein